MANPLRFGLKLSQQVHPMEAQRDAWKIADDAGFDHIWPFDHLIALGPDPAQPIFDGWTTLGAAAEATKRARIGLNVTGNLYRHPGLLAKIAVTVDHLSKGRLEFGIGAAWNEPEFKMYGLPFPSAADRIRMLDESIQAMKLLWTLIARRSPGGSISSPRRSPSRSPCRSRIHRSGSAARDPSARCGSSRSTPMCGIPAQAHRKR